MCALFFPLTYALNWISEKMHVKRFYLPLLPTFHSYTNKTIVINVTPEEDGEGPHFSVTIYSFGSDALPYSLIH